MKKSIPFLLLILLSISLWFYYRPVYRSVESRDLPNTFIMNSAGNFKGYYYLGSDSSGHYFKSEWSWVKDGYFKIAAKDMIVYDPFNYSDGLSIKLDVFKTDSIFGTLNRQKIYFAH